MQFVKRYRAPIQVGFDALCWCFALSITTLTRVGFQVSRVDVPDLAFAILISTVAQLFSGLVFGLYRGRWRFGSFDEAAGLFQSALLSTVLLSVTNLLRQPHFVPRSVPLGAFMAAIVLMGGGRCLWRLLDESRRRPRGDSCERVIVFGAGEGAVQIIKAMLRNPLSHYLPVALLDDDPRKRNLRLMGIPVVGNRGCLGTAAAQHRADTLLIAIPSASARLIAELSKLAVACGLGVKVLPPVSELLGDSLGVSDIREPTSGDLLGRHEVHTDMDSIAEYVTGKRILVTGAGGSIGSELCRQIYRFAPAELIMLDRDESALHSVQLSIEGRALLDTPDIALADIRDRASLEQLFARRRPEVVFHAAALKHLPVLERHPSEAVKTNVWGTLDLLEIAVRTGVERFVNISTDKACDPCSVLGYTKRLTERLTAFMGLQSSTVCLSVRFGNVLGSRGSVLTTFQAQMDKGGPITVTHPEVTRYFMTVEEAVQLVVQAGAIGQAGEVLVLDMGEPVRIAELARVLAARSDRPITIQYTGLRPGEKLHEALFGSNEEDHRPVHPLISHVQVPPLEPELARRIDLDLVDEAVVAQLREFSGRPAVLAASDD